MPPDRVSCRSMTAGGSGRRLSFKVYAVIWLAMMALRQDFWFWSDRRLVAGVLPIGLAYQAAYSLLAAGVLYALVRLAWPKELEQLGDSPRDADAGPERE